MSCFYGETLLVLISLPSLRKLAPLNLRFPEVVFSFFDTLPLFQLEYFEEDSMCFLFGVNFGALKAHMVCATVKVRRQSPSISTSFCFLLLLNGLSVSVYGRLSSFCSVAAEKNHLNPTTFSLDWLFSRCFCLPLNFAFILFLFIPLLCVSARLIEGASFVCGCCCCCRCCLSLRVIHK